MKPDVQLALQGKKITPLSLAMLRYQMTQDKSSEIDQGLANAKNPGEAIGYGIASIVQARRQNRAYESLSESMKEQMAQEETRKQNLVNSYPEEQRSVAANLPIEALEKGVAERIKPMSEGDNLDLEQKRLNLRKSQVDLQKSMRELNDPKSSISPKDRFDQAYKLRDKYTDLSKNYITSADAFTRIKSSAADPSPAGDLSLIYSYMKLLDPGSVVRESEFGLAETARPALEKAGVSWDRVKSIWEGKRLTSSQRNDFIVRAGKIFEGATRDQTKIKDQYTKLAQTYGISPEEVVLDYSGTGNQAAKPATPQQPPQEVAEGTMIRNKAGETLIARGGKWVRP